MRHPTTNAPATLPRGAPIRLRYQPVGKPVLYSVELYERDTPDVPVAHFGPAETPLPTFHPGDLLDPSTWDGLAGDGPFPGQLLRVLRSEVGIAEHEDYLVVKTLVYTVAVDDAEANRWAE
jgi:hypothetical protein